MNRLILASFASLAMAVSVNAAPPPGPIVRPVMPMAPIRVVIPPRPVIVTPVVVVPTTPGLNLYTPTTVMPVTRTYSLFVRSSLLDPWSYYGSYTSRLRAEEVGFLLEYNLGYEAWVR
jgi:hypothetical protein